MAGSNACVLLQRSKHRRSENHVRAQSPFSAKVLPRSIWDSDKNRYNNAKKLKVARYTTCIHAALESDL
jgi:hypothetical protein